jgi:ethanolamine utilization protein EutA
MAGELGLNLRISKPVTRSERSGIGKALADTILDYLEEESLSPLGTKLAIAGAPSSPVADMVQFSGGAAEYVYGFQTQPFGDIGQEWGEAIRKRAPRLGVKMAVHTPAARLRAVPIGAASYAVQLPHEKVYGSHGHFHGFRNLMVVAPQFPAGMREAGRARAEVEQVLSRFDLLNGSQPFALSLDFLEKEESYQAAAEGIFAALGDRMDHDSPLVLAGESDAPVGVAKLLASRPLPEGSLIALPSLHLHDLDFLDLGEVEHGGDLVVWVRSLVFR